MQCVTPEIGMDFQGVKDVLWYIFLPALFQGATTQIPRRAMANMPVKQARLALPDPSWTLRANWMASCMITGHLVAALRRTAEFRLVDQALLMG